MERCLLDTMAVLWMSLRPDLLGKTAARRLSDPHSTLAYSIVSLWEIGIKMAGKGYADFQLPENWEVALPRHLEEQGIILLNITPANCRHVQDLPFHHKDPFDRMLIAQALEGDFTVIGSDEIFDEYGVKRLW